MIAHLTHLLSCHVCPFYCRNPTAKPTKKPSAKPTPAPIDPVITPQPTEWSGDAHTPEPTEWSGDAHSPEPEPVDTPQPTP